jgi:hypothetical protein
MHADAWGKWFQQNAPADFVPFLYLFDEPTSTWVNSVETWAQWKAADTGAGQTLLSMSTYDFVDAQTQMADVQIPTSHAGYGFCPGDVKPCALTSITQSAADYYSSTPGKKLWMYSNNRPGTGSADTEDVGVAMRQVAWAQYKKGVDRWFYWQIEPNSAQDLFNNPVTWSYGSGLYFNQGLGMTDGGASSNGEGLLVYPGTDVVNAASSYGVNGPFASLRLKEWRRGIQDVDYLALAAAIDPASVQTLVNKTVPQVLWDFPNTDPSWWVAPAGWTQPWSDDPDDWESARAQLSNIVSNYCVNNPGAAPCN